MALQQTRNNRYLLLCVLATLAAPGWCAAAATQMRPGQWEVTVRMDMPGMPAQAQHAQTMSQCVTPELAADPRAAMEKLNDHKQGNMKCTMAHYDASGNKATWSIECTGEHPAQMNGEMTYDGDSAYHGTTKMVMQGPQGPMNMTQVIQARRVGDCKP